MKKLWLFYPGHDIALADGRPSFTLPPAAVRLMHSGETLPMWTGDDGDMFMCSGVNERWFSSMQAKFDIKAGPWDHVPDLHPEPWGWDRATRHIFMENGYSSDTLPDDDALDNIRMLSHRGTSIELCRQLAALLPFEIWPPAVEAHTIDRLSDILETQPESVIKAPWSSSGRGITFTATQSRERVLSSAAGTIRRQGSVTVEPYARRIADFAMLFDYRNGQARFIGLSLFKTDNRGHYHGNIVAPQNYLEEVLGRLTVPGQLTALADIMPAALSTVLGTSYSGPLGVDMMVVDGPCGNPMLHAAVEINLRYTMGFVALSLERIIKGAGLFTITPGDTTGPRHYTDNNGLLTSGTLPLNPPGGDFTFTLSACPNPDDIMKCR